MCVCVCACVCACVCVCVCLSQSLKGDYDFLQTFPCPEHFNLFFFKLEYSYITEHFNKTSDISKISSLLQTTPHSLS